eukprot:COSAG02_NODE_1151_length_14205_cov_1183.813342_6_plen_95_part_00
MRHCLFPLTGDSLRFCSTVAAYGKTPRAFCSISTGIYYVIEVEEEWPPTVVLEEFGIVSESKSAGSRLGRGLEHVLWWSHARPPTFQQGNGVLQ